MSVECCICRSNFSDSNMYHAELIQCDLKDTQYCFTLRLKSKAFDILDDNYDNWLNMSVYASRFGCLE